MSSDDGTTGHETKRDNVTSREKRGRQQDELSIVSEEFDAEEEQRLVKKLDLFIMPIMAVVYFFQYIDKNSLTYTAVFGLRNDLNLTDKDYSWAISVFYIGQLASQYPAAYILSRFHIIRFIGATIISCGIMEMCIGASYNFEGLVTCRFLLGLAQAAVSPAFVMLTSNWYRQHEHPMRVATWISMNGISQMTGGLLMYTLGDVEMEIRSWRVVFLVLGALTIVFGVVFVVMMPVNIATAWFLSPRERGVAMRRLAMDRTTCDKAIFDYQQLLESLCSPLSWMYFFMAYYIASANPIAKYSSIVIDRVGFSRSDSMLVGLPAGILNFITSWVSALVPCFFPNTRIYTALCLILIPLAGSIMLFVFSSQTNETYSWGIAVSTWLATCYTAPLCSCAGLLASNVKGNTKTSVVGAGFFVAYSIGSIIAPLMWGSEGDTRYLAGCTFTIVNWSLLMITLVTYLLIIKTENHARDRQAANRRLNSEVGGPGGRDDDLADVSED
ncbi:hypothetical protein FVEN_g5844 [Fusarium venenatum]|uniref:Major facilitator superfamily (MFS) profile domain-containing protein n=1 Tax=Fusarium venenatum TaxID=56646 RepID=A0A2L2TQH0_9HYPO|nr:uncharacterized protein FVRRES_03759 [Fusarium venenatum]KAG8356620.1 hypothetical protein FVEN_g5844 [Fusarium venenatum]KAH7003242.1 major facilitator superfamily domain-containing protein [Fusarium venenatum]CEI67247.1 unnamed protein product [Fusarium venenatum]